jgi:putative glutamine amidotransferase
MRILLSQRVVQSAPPAEEFRDAISHDWLAYLAAQGHEAALLPNVPSDPRRVRADLERARPDWLVFTGGDDLIATVPAQSDARASALYQRDLTERHALAHALERGIRVLGVCRGFQMLNVHFGGRVELLPNPEVHRAREHGVRFVGPWLARASGREELRVNSFHNQGIVPAGLARELEAAAFAEDGTVEAARHRSLPVWGVMWHPERPFGEAVAQAFHHQNFFEKIDPRGDS